MQLRRRIQRVADASLSGNSAPSATQSGNRGPARIKARRRSARSAEVLISISFRDASNAAFHPTTPTCPSSNSIAMMRVPFATI